MMDDTDDEECPVCCEPLDATDKAVNYCDCGYRMCIWCWNKLMETAAQSSLAGKCPNCRAVYDKDKITMSRVDPEMVMEERKKQKQERKKNPGAIPKNRKDLAHIRVVQRNLVYAVGLPLNLCREELLQEKNYFGQFGRMKKVSVNRVGPWAQAAAKGATGSCYVTYYRVEDAVRCIDAIDGATWGGKTIKACFGTTKYCNAFLKNVICNNPDCLYLHDIADEADSFYKDEVQDGVQLVRQQLLESLKVRGKGGAAPPAANPQPPPAAAAKATLAATAVVANALAPAAAGKGGPPTNAITIPLKRAVSQAPGAGTAWGTTPDAQSPAVTGLATWANAAAPKPPPATTGLLADQEWPSLAPTRDDDRASDPDKPSEPIAATLTPARSGPWGEKPLSRASSMTPEAPAAEPPAPRPGPTPIPTPMPAAAAAAAAAAKQAKPKVITLTKLTKGKGPLVMAVGKGKAAAPAGPQMQQLGVPAGGASTSGMVGDAKEGAAAQNGGFAAGAKVGDAGAGAVPSTPPATKKAGGKVVAVPVGGAGGAKGAAAAAAGEGVPSVTAAVAAATAAVVGTVAVAGDGERREGGENGTAAAAPAALAGAGPKLVKGPPPGFTGRAPSATLPANIEPSVVAAVRAAANAAPSATLPVAPQGAPQATTAAAPPSIISPSDQPVASPPRPAHNGILSSLFRQQPTGTATPGPQPAPSPVVNQVPSLQSWVPNPNGPAPTARQPPSTGPPSSSSDHSLTFPTLPSAVPSPTLSPATSAAKPAPARPPPGFSQPLYPTAKLGLTLGAAPGGGSQGGDIDVNALFSHIPPTPLDDPWAATATSTAAVGPAAAPAQPIHSTPAPRLQSRFAFAREEAAPQQAQQPRPQQQQPEELSRLFQKIAPGASVHVAHSPADPHSNGPLANGAFNPGTPHSPNPGMALLAQLQRKPSATEAPPSTSAGPPKGPPPGMPATFADPAILTAGKNPLAAPSHFQQPPPGMGMPLGHHRPGELSLAGGQQGGVAAAGEPPGMPRAPARGPPPGFANVAGFPGASGTPLDFALPYSAAGAPRPLGGEGVLANGHALPNGYLHEQQKGFAPFGTRL